MELLRRVSRRYRDSSERLVRVIDGLYEVAAKRGSNPLAAFLPLPLPPGVSVLRSSRRDYSHPALFLREPHSATIELDDEKT